jgi:hypothetical protein
VPTARLFCACPLAAWELEQRGRISALTKTRTQSPHIILQQDSRSHSLCTIGLNKRSTDFRVRSHQWSLDVTETGRVERPLCLLGLSQTPLGRRWPSLDRPSLSDRDELQSTSCAWLGLGVGLYRPGTDPQSRGGYGASLLGDTNRSLHQPPYERTST